MADGGTQCSTVADLINTWSGLHSLHNLFGYGQFLSTQKTLVWAMETRASNYTTAHSHSVWTLSRSICMIGLEVFLFRRQTNSWNTFSRKKSFVLLQLKKTIRSRSHIRSFRIFYSYVSDVMFVRHFLVGMREQYTHIQKHARWRNWMHDDSSDHSSDDVICAGIVQCEFGSRVHN